MDEVGTNVIVQDRRAMHRCGFCGLDELQVEMMIVANPETKICSGCVDICAEVVADKRAKKIHQDE